MNSTEKQPMSIAPTRRGFLKTIATAVAAGTALQTWPRGAHAGPNLTSGTDEAFWRTVRSSFVLDANLTYMNIGTTGSTPRHVLQAFDENSKAIAANPRENLGGTAPMRAAIAASYGVAASEIVMTTNTTDGMCMSFHGLDWASDDEIITSIHEHPGGLGPLNTISFRRGIPVRYVTLPSGPDQTVADYVNAFETAILNSKAAGRNPQTMMFSHITYKTGTKLPANELCALARSYGMRTIIDGAHATGMLNLDWHGMGVDLYAGSGHKWQCGPGGTGIWYVRNGMYQPGNIELSALPFHGTLVSGNPRGRLMANGGPADIGAYLQSHGNPNYPEWKALQDVCEFWADIGRDRIEAHDLGLSAYVKARIVATFPGGRAVLTAPDNPALLSALTGFNPFAARVGIGGNSAAGQKASQFVERLREEYGFVIRNVTYRSAAGATGVFPQSAPAEDNWTFRISTHLFHNRNDVDRLVAAMYDLAVNMGGLL
ncbi:MAG TPA: aminotransferase class V-fold PLP-dependent enzyme [Myxococcaceae bacterium]|jgi:selenocysteine lyase/cysteine desulfurase|nr:aminotransferase class V-fold PLP-dependent enzyme [Myxococcaceae bacterium]